jgi:hypothetical protein
LERDCAQFGFGERPGAGYFAFDDELGHDWDQFTLGA